MTDVDGQSLEWRGREAHAAGEYETAVRLYEDAYAALRAEGDLLAAARAARTVGWFRGWVFGDWAVHRGWVARARRLLEHADDERGRGWVLLDDALHGQDLDRQRQLYDAAIEIGRRTNDADLECDATASLGMMLVFSGAIADGMTRLDEVLAAICGGEVTELPVVGCLCGLITACAHTNDVTRADEWLRAATRVMQQRNLVTVAGYCRAHYAGILIAAGRWGDAEDELTAVLDVLPAGTRLATAARCRLADLRVRLGRLEDAELLLDGMHDDEDAFLPLTALLIARAQAERALELLDRALLVAAEAHVEAPRLARWVDASLAVGAVDQARAGVDRLRVLAADHPSPYLHAQAAAADARVCAAVDDPRALPAWREALAHYLSAQMPTEAAEVRLALARALASDRPDAARAEADAAHRTFERAGARRGADEAAALLRRLGGEAKPGPKQGGTLTRREQEVLDLLGHGLTNAEIADRLYISPKTTEHHVSRVLTKLGLRSRTEAAAFNARRR